MKKIVLSTIMCFALMASSAVMAQDTKKASKAKKETTKECTDKEKKECPEKKEAQKSCCSSEQKK